MAGAWGVSLPKLRLPLSALPRDFVLACCATDLAIKVYLLEIIKSQVTL